jgi:hypothetical protein
LAAAKACLFGDDGRGERLGDQYEGHTTIEMTEKDLERIVKMVEREQIDRRGW